MPSQKPRIRVRISSVNHIRLLTEVDHGRLSQAEIVDRALSRYFYETENEVRDASLLNRLTLMSRHDARLTRDLALVHETLALFVQYFFTVMPSIDPEDSRVRAAQGAGHFQHFLDELSVRMKGGGKTIKNALEDVLTTDKDFFTQEELARLKSLDDQASNENLPALRDAKVKKPKSSQIGAGS